MRDAPPNDTDPKVDAILIAGYRRMAAWQKLERMCALNRMGQELALADLRRRYPDDSPREQRLRLASRWLDADLMRKVFGWDPGREGM
ncbi:MAG: hypothetical protein KF819_06605 [Labilithrix sp.]|nr:hypothetical protein [Labilithrix sp.]